MRFQRKPAEGERRKVGCEDFLNIEEIEVMKSAASDDACRVNDLPAFFSSLPDLVNGVLPSGT